MFLYLCKVYVKLDQPMNALDYFQKVERERGRGREGGREKGGEFQKNIIHIIISTGIGKVQEWHHPSHGHCKSPWGIITYTSDQKKNPTHWLIWYIVDCQFPQGLGDLDTAVTHYRDVLKSDSTCVEAIACIATHHFYSDQPELALRFYRYTNFGPILTIFCSSMKISFSRILFTFNTWLCSVNRYLYNAPVWIFLSFNSILTNFI